MVSGENDEDGSEIALRIIVYLWVDQRAGCQRKGCGDHPGVSARGGTGDIFATDAATRAGAVPDDDRRAVALLEEVGDHAGRAVSCSTRGEGNHQAHRTARKSFARTG
jgi:hypothetical protein